MCVKYLGVYLSSILKFLWSGVDLVMFFFGWENKSSLILEK